MYLFKQFLAHLTIFTHTEQNNQDTDQKKKKKTQNIVNPSFTNTEMMK